MNLKDIDKLQQNVELKTSILMSKFIDDTAKLFVEYAAADKALSALEVDIRTMLLTHINLEYKLRTLGKEKADPKDVDYMATNYHILIGKCLEYSQYLTERSSSLQLSVLQRKFMKATTEVSIAIMVASNTFNPKDACKSKGGM